MDVHEDANPLWSTCITTSLTESSEILLQIIPLKILGNNGKSITTYGLIDSGFDVTMIDPSLVDQHEIQGEQELLFLPIVSQKDKRQQGVKVSFKIAPVCHQECSEVTVRDAWAVIDLTIPFKDVAVRRKMEQWPQLEQVPFPDVGRKIF